MLRLRPSRKPGDADERAQPIRRKYDFTRAHQRRRSKCLASTYFLERYPRGTKVLSKSQEPRGTKVLSKSQEPRGTKVPLFRVSIAKDAPPIYGLHANADFTFRLKESNEMLKTLLYTQPKDALAAGGMLQKDQAQNNQTCFLRPGEKRVIVHGYNL